MIDRSLVIIFLIALTVCFTLWRTTIEEQQYLQEYSTVTTLNYDALNTGVLNETQPTNITIALELMPHNDFRRLIDINDFHYTQNQNGCPIEPTIQTPLAIILIHTAPANRFKRDVIRDTWATKNDTRVRAFFLVGATNLTRIQHRLEHENSIYNDIIQGSFKDAYHNMTYKHIMAFKWFIYNCPKVRYLVKTDDDVFVNTPYLLDYLETKAEPQNFLFCLKMENSRIKRTYRSKWRVSPREFPGVFYPPYCPGFSIIYSADAAWRLYIEAQRTKYFWIDDVHITGTLAQKLNLTITPMGDYIITGSPINRIFDGQTKIQRSSDFIFADPDLNETQIRALWNVVARNRNDTHLT